MCVCCVSCSGCFQYVQQFPVSARASGLHCFVISVCGWYSEDVCICGCVATCLLSSRCVCMSISGLVFSASVGSVSRWVCILSLHVG